MIIKPKTMMMIIIIILTSLMQGAVFSESLFSTGISQNSYAIQPRSLYSSVRAKTIGDFITIIIDETISTSDESKLGVSKSSSTTDGFSTFLNKILPGKIIPTGLNDFGGSNTVSGDTKVSRKSTLSDTVTVQVVQVLPNGNLVVQGKKSEINSGEKVDVVVSGIVDPRTMNYLGKVNSSQVANFQIAIVGKGTVSRSDSEGTINKFIRYLF